MSLYNLLFGANPASDQLLALLNLTRADVGRFRDCYVEGEHIVVHTRNGGGNRECWHARSPTFGNPECKHHVVQAEEDEIVEVREGPIVRYQRTGKRVIVDRYVCEEPDSAACACPGCVIEYRLPAHPLYVRDEDDDFDCTYADIRFRFPPEHAAWLARYAEEHPTVPPAERWQALFATLPPAGAR